MSDDQTMQYVLESVLRGADIAQTEGQKWKARAAAWKRCAKQWRDTAIFNREERFRGFGMISESNARAEKAEADAAVLREELESVLNEKMLSQGVTEEIEEALKSNAGRDLLERLEKAEQQSTELKIELEALEEIASERRDRYKDAERALQLHQKHCGELETELEAAREVVKAAKDGYEQDDLFTVVSEDSRVRDHVLGEALANYDACVKR